MLKEFKDFILKGNIITIAIGLVLAAAFGAVVTAFVDNVITPIIGSMSENGIGEALSIKLRGVNRIRIGALLDAIIKFLAIGAALFFFVVKPLKKVGFNLDEEK